MSDAGLMVSVSELAGIKGVSQPAISKRLKKFEMSGLLQPTREGGRVMVRLTEWDRAARETTDPSRLVARTTAAAARSATPEPPDDDPIKDPTYQQHLTRKTAFEADLKEDQLRKQRGELLDAAQVEDAWGECLELLVSEVDHLPSFAEDLAAALNKTGIAGLREALKGKARDIRAAMAQSMQALGNAEVDEADGT